MKKGLIIFILILFIQFISFAKKLDSLNYTDHKEFFLHWDNDIFLFKDYYYTQGAHISLVNPALRKNPANYIFLRLKNADNYYGMGIIQEIYTPKDVMDTLLNLVDRPYAGTLYLRSFITSSVPEKRLRLTSQFDLGILGPLAGAKQAQQIIHDWLDLGFPEGWDFQVNNRPYINYNLALEKGLLTSRGVFDFTANSRLRVGTAHDDLQVGGMFRIGRLNNFFKGLSLDNKKYTENHDFQVYISGGASATVVLYNATLMGGIVAPEEYQKFKFNEIEHLVGELTGEIRMNYKFVGLAGQLTWKTKEFELGEQHGWGTISMYFRF